MVQVAGVVQLFTRTTVGVPPMAVITVGSEAVLLVTLDSPPPATLTLLVNVPEAAPAILTVNPKTRVPVVAAMAVAEVQVIVWGDAALELQVQLAAFVPEVTTAPAAPPLTERPTGRLSVTVIPPLLAAPPMFDTVREYVPVPPAVKLPACDLAIVKSGMLGIALTTGAPHPAVGVLAVVQVVATGGAAPPVGSVDT